MSMKTALIIILVIAISLIGCTGWSDPGNVPKKDSGYTLCDMCPTLDEIEIEGCEYFIYFTGGNRGLMAHKGNCKNKIHCYNE